MQGEKKDKEKEASDSTNSESPRRNSAPFLGQLTTPLPANKYERRKSLYLKLPLRRSSLSTGDMEAFRLARNLSQLNMLEGEELPSTTILSDIVELTSSPKELEKIWEDIFGHSETAIKTVFPLDNKTRNLLLKRITQKSYIKLLNSLNIKPISKELHIGKISYFEILSNNPNLPEVISNFEGNKGVDKLSELENKIIFKINEVNNSLKVIRESLQVKLSYKNSKQNELLKRRLALVYKLLKHYTPQNSAYVLGLIGKIRHPQIVANSLYFCSSAIRFIIKQYEAYLIENEKRLAKSQDKVKELLAKLIGQKLIIKSNGNYHLGIDANSVNFILLETWKSTLSKNNIDFKNIHSLKTSEYSLNMFIALTEFLLESKQSDSNFHYNEKLGSKIIEEFSLLISNNLNSNNANNNILHFLNTSSSNYSYMSISPDIFKYKLEYISNLLESGNLKTLKPLPATEEQITTNDTRIKNTIKETIEWLTGGRGYVMSKGFLQIYDFHKDGSLETNDDKIEKTYIVDTRLTNLMTFISDSISSQAGLKGSLFELKLLLIAKTILITFVSYVINRAISHRALSEPVKLLINYHGINYLNSYLKYFISLYEDKLIAEYNKYNELDKEFNKIIETLFKYNSIYPVLDENLTINRIIVDTSLKKLLRIIADSFDNAHQTSGSNNQNNKEATAYLSQITPQDLSAMTKVLFIELSKYVINPSGKGINLELLNFKCMSDISDSFGGLISSSLIQKGNKFHLYKSPEELGRTIRKSLDEYMDKFKDNINNSPTNIQNNKLRKSVSFHNSGDNTPPDNYSSDSEEEESSKESSPDNDGEGTSSVPKFWEQRVHHNRRNSSPNLRETNMPKTSPRNLSLGVKKEIRMSGAGLGSSPNVTESERS